MTFLSVTTEAPAKVFLVGGNQGWAKRRLIPGLMHKLPVKVIGHFDYDRSDNKLTIPKNAELVVTFIDVISHSKSAAAKKQAVAAGLPYVAAAHNISICAPIIEKAFDDVRALRELRAESQKQRSWGGPVKIYKGFSIEAGDDDEAYRAYWDGVAATEWLPWVMLKELIDKQGPTLKSPKPVPQRRRVRGTRGRSSRNQVSDIAAWKVLLAQPWLSRKAADAQGIGHTQQRRLVRRLVSAEARDARPDEAKGRGLYVRYLDAQFYAEECLRHGVEGASEAALRRHNVNLRHPPDEVSEEVPVKVTPPAPVSYVTQTRRDLQTRLDELLQEETTLTQRLQEISIDRAGLETACRVLDDFIGDNK